jgi:hypothetical protein
MADKRRRFFDEEESVVRIQRRKPVEDDLWETDEEFDRMLKGKKFRKR